MEAAIEESLRSIAADFREKRYKSYSDLTRQIKSKLAELGEEVFNCCVATSGFNGTYEKEWLYDLVWYKEDGDGDNKRLTDVPLVMECEWNQYLKEIKYDFEKLLLANARLRLFICFVSPNDFQSVSSYFKDAVRKYELGKKDDRFLIAILKTEDKEFYFERIDRSDEHSAAGHS